MQEVNIPGAGDGARFRAPGQASHEAPAASVVLPITEQAIVPGAADEDQERMGATGKNPAIIGVNVPSPWDVANGDLVILRSVMNMDNGD